MTREVSHAEHCLLEAYKRFNDAAIARNDAMREYDAALRALREELKTFPHFELVLVTPL